MKTYKVEGTFYMEHKNDKYLQVRFDYQIQANSKYDARESVLEMHEDEGVFLQDGEYDIFEQNLGGIFERCVFKNPKGITVVYGNSTNDVVGELYENEDEAMEHYDFVKEHYAVAYLQ